MPECTAGKTFKELLSDVAHIEVGWGWFWLNAQTNVTIFLLVSGRQGTKHATKHLQIMLQTVKMFI